MPYIHTVLYTSQSIFIHHLILTTNSSKQSRNSEKLHNFRKIIKKNSNRESRFKPRSISAAWAPHFTSSPLVEAFILQMSAPCLEKGVMMCPESQSFFKKEHK